jgi:hypothetical protein
VADGERLGDFGILRCQSIPIRLFNDLTAAGTAKVRGHRVRHQDLWVGVVGLEIKARSLLGSRYIRHLIYLIEHKLRGNPAHSLQNVPQSRTDFQFARRTEAAKTVQTTCDNADQFPSRHCVVIRSDRIASDSVFHLSHSGKLCCTGRRHLAR